MSVQLPIHGGQLEALAKQYMLDPRALLDFSANINPDGPPVSVLQALQSSLSDATTLMSYPDLQHSSLKQSIAASICNPSCEISIANGFVPLLEAVLRALPIRSCLLPLPAFNEYRPALDRARIKVVPYGMTPESGFQYDAQQMLAGEADAVILANPQNPSGVCATESQMVDLLHTAADRSMYVLLDEAFIDYVPEHSMVPYLGQFPKLILFRSVTKFYAMPGMRIAYCIADPSVALSINNTLPPWPVSNLASIAVHAALRDEAYEQRTRYLNAKRKARLFDGLAALELQPHPGAANFLLFRLPSHVDPLAFWQAMMVNHKIVLRSCENYPHLGSGYLRTAVRGDDHNEMLLQALSAQLVR